MKVLRAGLLVLLACAVALPTGAAEREMDQDAAPASVDEIETPIQRVFPDAAAEAPPLLPGLRHRLRDLPAFLADSRLEARFRTYALRKRRPGGSLSEAWAAGGSISWRSGWLQDLLAVEVEGFTSQRVVGSRDRSGTLLLSPVQQGYSVLGIANAKLRHRGVVLTGYRQYLDLPYVNRNDSRMTPVTYEAITLAKPEGRLRFSTGYAWKVKLRTSDRFRSFTEAIGLSKDRGFFHAGAVWDPAEHLHLGAIVGGVPDLFGGAYAELGVARDLSHGWEGRIDAQATSQWDVGDDLLGSGLDDTWNLGLRGSASRGGLVLRLGASVTGSNGRIVSPFGTNPSYVDLMQRTFNRADEKAVLLSASYDFSKRGIPGLSAILNAVAGFDARLGDVRRDAQEVDLTLDYRVKEGFGRGLWLRVRGSWLNERGTRRDGTDFRVILRYDLPVL